MVVTAAHLASQAALRHHVGALAPEHLLGGEADGAAGEGAHFTVAAVHLPQSVLLAHLAVHHADVEGDGDALTAAGGVTPTVICGEKTGVKK